jgi:hypothetical protein
MVRDPLRYARFGTSLLSSVALLLDLVEEHIAWIRAALIIWAPSNVHFCPSR